MSDGAAEGEDAETERAVYVQRLDPDQREAYVAAHDDVPAAVTDAMARGGVRSFDLFVRDDIAVCVLEAEDVDAYLDAVTDDPDVEEWERYVAQFKREGVDVDADPDEQIPFMERIWEFSPDSE
jgi:L-rhamnose mutarotase